MELLAMVSLESMIMGLLLIKSLAFTNCMRKQWEYNTSTHQLFRCFKKMHCSFRREVLCNILIEFGIPKKIVGFKCVSRRYLVKFI
jgi:hypothetical protein